MKAPFRHLLLGLLFLTGCRHALAPSSTAVRAPLPPAPLSPRRLADYPWPHTAAAYDPLAARLPVQAGYWRVVLPDRSFGQWLRYLPLLPPGTPVRAVDGAALLSGDSPYLAAVVDLDLRRNQECADVILRLRAEYLRWANREGEIAVPTGEGVSLSWPQWKRGTRPRQYGGRLRLMAGAAAPDGSRASFDRYLASVFAWCGTYALEQMGRPVALGGLQPGDYFVRGGSPGHAVLVADLARDAAGHAQALLLQGYMPAQSAHLISTGPGGPWYELAPGQPLVIPGWGQFHLQDARRFREPNAGMTH
jgi:hypothetical protein